MSPSRKQSMPGSMIRVRLDGDLSAKIAGKSQLAALRRCIQDGQLCVDLSIECGPDSYGIGAIYADSLAKGGFKAVIEGKRLVVRICGDFMVDVECFARDKSFRRVLSGGSIVLGSMADPDCEPLVLEGGSRTVPVGTVVPSDAEPSRPTKKQPAKEKRKATRTPLQCAVEILLAPQDGIARVARSLVGKRDSMDYVLERQLETITEALLKDSQSVKAILSSRSASMRELGTVLRKVWLEAEIPECGFELKVRAAEALGAWSAATEESRTTITKRLASKRFEHRMWAAQAVRAAGWKDAARVLKPLASDPFCDDNGIHLVREAAGFFE